MRNPRVRMERASRSYYCLLLFVCAALVWKARYLQLALDNTPPLPATAVRPPPRASGARIVVASANIWQGRRKVVSDDLASRDFIAELARRNHEAYCARWGYTYKMLAGQVWRTREAMYKKMPFVLELLSSGEFTHIFWMDLDSLFTNFEVALETLEGTPPRDFVFTGEPDGLLNARLPHQLG